MGSPDQGDGAPVDGITGTSGEEKGCPTMGQEGGLWEIKGLREAVNLALGIVPRFGVGMEGEWRGVGAKVVGFGEGE